MQIKNRSTEENAYYWGVVLERLSRYFKEPAEKIHFRIKNEFEIISTSILTTVEFENLMNELRVWANLHLGVFIPLPKEEEEMLLPRKPRMMFKNNKNLDIIVKTYKNA